MFRTGCWRGILISLGVAAGVTESGCTDEGELDPIQVEFPCEVKAKRGELVGCASQLTFVDGEVAWETRESVVVDASDGKWELATIEVEIGYSESGGSWKTRTTKVDENGVFRFQDVPRGPVYVAAGWVQVITRDRELDLRSLYPSYDNAEHEEDSILLELKFKKDDVAFAEEARVFHLYCESVGEIGYARVVYEEGLADDDDPEVLGFEGVLAAEFANFVDFDTLEDCELSYVHGSGFDKIVRPRIKDVDFDKKDRSLVLEVELEEAREPTSVDLDWRVDDFGPLPTGVREESVVMAAFTGPDTPASQRPGSDLNVYYTRVSEAEGLEYPDSIEFMAPRRDELAYLWMSRGFSAHHDGDFSMMPALTSVRRSRSHWQPVSELGSDVLRLDGDAPLPSKLKVNGKTIDLDGISPEVKGETLTLSWAKPSREYLTVIEAFGEGKGWFGVWTEENKIEIPTALRDGATMSIYIAHSNCRSLVALGRQPQQSCDNASRIVAIRIAD